MKDLASPNVPTPYPDVSDLLLKFSFARAPHSRAGRHESGNAKTYCLQAAPDLPL